MYSTRPCFNVLIKWFHALERGSVWKKSQQEIARGDRPTRLLTMETFLMCKGAFIFYEHGGGGGGGLVGFG